MLVILFIIILLLSVINYYFFRELQLYKKKVMERIKFIEAVSEELHQFSSQYAYVNDSNSKELLKMMRLSNAVCLVTHFFNSDVAFEKEKQKFERGEYNLY